MNTTMSRLTAVLFAIPLFAGATQAATIAGSFTGIADYTLTYSISGPTLHRTVTGEAVVGSFVATTGPCVFGDISQGCAVVAANNVITLDVAGQILVFNGGPASFQITDGAAGEILTYTPVETQPYETANLVLAGAQDAFTNGLALDTLHPGPVDLSASSLGFAEARSIVGEVQLTSLQFTSIPEPSGWTLLLPAALLSALFRPRHAKVVQGCGIHAGRRQLGCRPACKMELSLAAGWESVGV